MFKIHKEQSNLVTKKHLKMDKFFEYTFPQRQYTNGQYVCQKMFNFIIIEELQVKIPMGYNLTCQNSSYEKTKYASAAEGIGEGGPLHIAGRNVNQYNHCEK